MLIRCLNCFDQHTGESPGCEECNGTGLVVSGKWTIGIIVSIFFLMFLFSCSSGEVMPDEHQTTKLEVGFVYETLQNETE